MMKEDARRKVKKVRSEPMGQCVSRKAASALASANSHSRPTDMQKHKKFIENSDEKTSNQKKSNVPSTKGVAMSFGFKKHNATPQSIAIHNRNIGSRLAASDAIDRNGNSEIKKNIPQTTKTTVRLPAPKKEANAARVSRFGFRQPNRYNKVTDVDGTAPRQIDNNNFNGRAKAVKLSAGASVLVAAGKFTLHTSQLPKPQVVERIEESKAAKTFVNNTRKYCNRYQMEAESSSKEGSIAGDSGVGSNCSGRDDLDVKQLNCSPQRSFRKYKRNFDVVVTGNKFDVREVNEDIPLQRTTFHTGYVREKASEYEKKNCCDEEIKRTFLKTNSNSSDEWAAGEAMADEEDIQQTDDALKTMMINTVRSLVPKEEVQKVLLTIEDPKFAAVAEASNSSALLDDETSPTDSLLCYSESDFLKNTKMNESSSYSKDINEKLTMSPSSPCSPTNASLSLSDGRDFFVDDEIADQPALVFDDTLTNCENASEGHSTVVDAQKPPKKPFRAFEGSPMLRRRLLMGGSTNQTGSLDTLSPCESITSEDLMLDFEYSHSSGLDEGCERRCDEVGKVETTPRRNQWPYKLETTPDRTIRTSRLLPARARTPCSIPDSPRSLESRLNARLVCNSPLRRTSTTSYDSDDSINFERSNNIAISQDVMSIKTMLLRLKRVLLEQTEEDQLLRSETHNPFESQVSLRNGIFSSQNSNFGCEDPSNVEEAVDARLQLADLKRQVLFLQGQLEDKEKVVQNLQTQIVKIASDVHSANSAPASTVVHEFVNAATQTERVRPLSAGPLLFQSSSNDAGGLVSASETSTKVNRTRAAAKLCRRPGEPPSPRRYNQYTSALRRTSSQSRGPSTPS